MPHTALVSAEVLARHLDDPRWRVFDCRHDLARPDAGREEYSKGHIPGAGFLHLDRDLAGPTTGSNGRHPLPDPDVFAEKLRDYGGLSSGMQVVAYDAQGGAFAARLWWMLQWLGHAEAAVLDGGWQQWTAEKRPVSAASPRIRRGDFRPSPEESTLDAAAVLSGLGSLRLVDARAPDRYRGENETLDPAGGRIPGAVNRFYRDNLGAEGRFKPAETLRAEFGEILRGPGGEVVHYCGSGVTACHNLLAMRVAGFEGMRLYPGSWSEWSADPSRPRAAGEPRPDEASR